MIRQLPVFQALGHSLSSTFNNIGFAFHVSWPWMLVRLPISLATSLYFLSNPVDPQQPFRADTFAILIVEGLVSLLIFASIAVNWHRYILRDELPQGTQRLRLDNDVFRYFGNTLLISLLGMLVGLTAIIPAFLVGALSVASPTLGLIVGIPLVVVWLVFILGTTIRWSLKLVAVALGREDLGIRDAWGLTEGNHLRIVGLYVLVILITFAIALVLGLLTQFLAGSASIAAVSTLVVMQLAINWIASIWNVTLLTSLYGFFEEKREF